MAKVYDTATDLITFARLQSQNTTSGSSYLGSDGLLKFAAEDEPRIEYGPDGSLKGLLIEEQRTNLVTHSDFSGGWGGKTQVSLSLNSVTSPTGQQDAMVVTSSGADPHVFDFNSVSSGNDYTFSVWLKGVGNTIGRSPRVWMLSTGGTVSSVVADTTPLTSEWRRYTSTGTCTASGIILSRIDFDDTGLSASGDQVYAFGAQLEEGSFATSYIPTSGSQQTRSADVASIPVSAFGYNQDAGTVVVEVGNHAGATAGSQYVVSLDNSSSAERMQVNRFNGNYILDVVDNSVSQVSASIGAGVDGSKVSFAYALNNFVATENGDTPVTDTTATVPTPSKLSIGIAYNSTAQLNGHIKSIQYYPRRLTNTQLQELTA